MIKHQITTTKKAAQGVAAHSFSREGEGHSVALAVVAVEKNAADGTETLRYGLDISQARVPQRRYAAELASVKVQDNELRFLFAIRTVAGDEFDSVLIIRMSPDAARSFIDSIRTIEKPDLPEILELMKISKEDRHTINKDPKNMGNVANMVANFVGVGISGYETTLDFYHASAFAMRVMPDSKSLDLDPKVRVDIRTSLFATLIEETTELLGQLSPSMRKAAQ